MPEDLTIEHRPRYLYARVTGAFNLKWAEKLYDKILAECGDHGQTNVLIDTREMGGGIPIIDRYAFGQYMAQVRRRGFRVAFVGTEEQVLPDRFLETVANNLGVPTFVSTSVDEAAGWLEKN